MDQGRIRRKLGAIALAVACLGCATSGAGGGDLQAPVGAPLPPLKVDSLSGKTINVASYKGQVLLLDVWASWCDPCKQELPMLDEMARRLAPRGRRAGRLGRSGARQRRQVLRSHGGHWSLTIAHDPRGEVADLLQPDKMPTSYVVDRAGIVRYVNAGFLPADASIIEQHLLEVAGH